MPHFSPYFSPYFSIVIPIYNEAACLDELIQRCLAVGQSVTRPFEIILVDDGSSDASPQKITDAARQCQTTIKIIGILLNRNYGQHTAVLAGLAEARGEVVVTLDADLQNPPEEIPKLLTKIEHGHDVVGSVRSNRHDPLFRRVLSRLINAMVRHVTGVDMHDYGCMLRAYRRQVVDAVLECREHSIFIPVLANSFASRPAEVEVAHAARVSGDSKYSLWKLLQLNFDLVTSMTTFPLRVLSVLGGTLASLGFALGILLAGLRLIYGAEWAVEGVFTLFAILFVFIGAQFTAMGLLGEYIGRIYQYVRARPRYHIRHIVGRDHLAVQMPLQGPEEVPLEASPQRMSIVRP